jgi:hypothetical protein
MPQFKKNCIFVTSLNLKTNTKSPFNYDQCWFNNEVPEREVWICAGKCR